MNGIIVFCIECNEMVAAECYEPFGCSHAIYTPIYSDNGQVVGLDSDLCFFPQGWDVFHPEFDPFWNDNAVEPGDPDFFVFEWATCPPPEIPEAFAIPPQDESVPEILQALAFA